MSSSKINWFSIDMDAFQNEYDEYLAAVEAHSAAVAQREACENGTCKHERRLKKDGSPNKGSRCPQEHASSNEEISTGNALFYVHHKGFWESIGLGVEANV